MLVWRRGCSGHPVSDNDLDFARPTKLFVLLLNTQINNLFFPDSQAGASASAWPHFFVRVGVHVWRYDLTPMSEMPKVKKCRKI
jgi:hypothetical protein